MVTLVLLFLRDVIFAPDTLTGPTDINITVPVSSEFVPIGIVCAIGLDVIPDEVTTETWPSELGFEYNEFMVNELVSCDELTIT